MGMFDTVYATCPKCKNQMMDQIKHGPCDMVTYRIADEMDLDDAMLVHGSSMYCSKCKIGFDVITDLPQRVNVCLKER
jgi:hypothetical protein